MDKMSRRSFLKPKLGMAAAVPAVGGIAGAVDGEGTSRKEFLQATAGAAAGAAVIVATPKVASVALDSGSASPAAEPKPVVTQPSGRPPHEPVTAFVRDAERGEVTVMSGTQETTYRDPALVKRMLNAAR
jgi:hypothetical protein